MFYDDALKEIIYYHSLLFHRTQVAAPLSTVADILITK